MNTPIEMIEEISGEHNLEKVEEGLRSGAAASLSPRLWEGWDAWSAEWEMPTLDPYSLCPYVLAHWRGDPTAGLAGFWQAAAAGSESNAFRSQLLSHLLFCDAVALPDPLMGTASPFPFFAYDVPLESEEVKRLLMANVIGALRNVRELIEKKVVIIVPGVEEPDLGGFVAEVAAIAHTLDAEFPQMPDGWLEITYAQRAAIDITSQVVAGTGGFDAYLPTNAHVHMFTELCKRADRELRALAGTTPIESRYLWRLLDCDLPGVSNLSFKDVVAVRRNDEFRTWRDAVRQGLAQAEEFARNEPDWPGLESATKREIAGSVQEAATEARKHSRWKHSSKLKMGLDMVGVGGAVVGAAVSGPAAPILAGAGALGIVADIFRRARFSRGSYMRHVAVFKEK